MQRLFYKNLNKKLLKGANLFLGVQDFLVSTSSWDISNHSFEILPMTTNNLFLFFYFLNIGQESQTYNIIS